MRRCAPPGKNGQASGSIRVVVLGAHLPLAVHELLYSVVSLQMTQGADRGDLEKELIEARQEIVELKARTKTTLTGSEFLTIVLVGPL